MIEMYLGLHSGGWAVDGRTRGWAAHTAPALGLAHWAQEIEQQHASRWRRARVSLWLSGGLARPFLTGPVEGLTTWSEADAMAAAAAPQATGFDGPCRVRLEDWPGDAATLGTAIEESFALAIDEVARARRITWLSVRPRWAAAIDEALGQRPSTSIVAFADADALTLLGGAPPHEAGTTSPAFDMAATYAPAPTGERAAALWLRTLLSRDVRAEDASFLRMSTPLAETTDTLAPADGRGARWPGAVRLSEEGTS